jgi:hypothetical protein
MIALDAASTVRTLQHLPLLAVRTDALVSPVGHLTHALAQALLEAGQAGPDARLEDAHAMAAEHLDRHFGDVTWESAVPANTSVPAPSPTEPVRAAFVQAGWPILAATLAAAADATLQEVNTFTLMEAWAADLAAGPFPGAFDGNDGNEQGGGLLLGACPPYADATCDENLAMCPIGACRNPCDLYAGTPRAFFGGAVRTYIRSTLNQTGLSDGDTLAIGTAIADNTDELLFGTACRDNLDRTPPIIVFEAPTPEAGEVVRQTQMVAARAVDDTEGTPPRITLTGPSGPLTDADGIPDNEVASTTIDTAAVTAATGDGSYTVTASARDISGNEATAERTFVIDNTAPTLTVSATGFFVRSVSGVEQWWSGVATPALTGTVTDANLAQVVVSENGTMLGMATVTGTAWSFTLPAGVANLAGTNLDVTATDPAGNSASATRRVHADTTPLTMASVPTTVLNELSDAISFTPDPVHTHFTDGAATLGSGGCPDVYKHVTLMGTNNNPLRVEARATDEAGGVGLDPATVRVRVDLGATVGAWRTLAITPVAGTTPLPMTLVQAGTNTATTQVVPELDSTEGAMTVVFEARDFLGRQATTSMCLTNHPLAPPVETTAAYVPGAGGPGHVHALRSAGLSTGNRVLAASLLNGTLAAPAPGLSVMDYEVMNPNSRPVYMTFTLPGIPTSITGYRRYVRHNALISTTNVMNNCETTPSACTPPAHQPVVNQQAQPLDANPIAATWAVRAFAVATAGGPLGAELPCTVCGVGGEWKFTVPARPQLPVVGAPVRVRVLTMLTSATGLWPTGGITTTGGADTSTAPYNDTTLTHSAGSVDITGLVSGTSYSGCILDDFLDDPPPIGNQTLFCIQRGTYRNFRALTYLAVGQIAVTNQPAAAPSATIAPRTNLSELVLAEATFSSFSITESAVP